jgi:hypothetical protein
MASSPSGRRGSSSITCWPTVCSTARSASCSPAARAIGALRRFVLLGRAIGLAASRASSRQSLMRRSIT